MIVILDFLKNGTFGKIQLGQSEKEIQSYLGSPNYKWDNARDGSIMSYGDIEFHFFKNKLFSIFCDSLSYSVGKLHMGNIKFDPWIIRKDNVLTLREMLKVLQKEHINFRVYKNTLCIRLHLESNVEIIFENELDDTIDHYKMSAFYLSEINSLYQNEYILNIEI